MPLVTLLTIGLSNSLCGANSPANTIKQLFSLTYKMELQLNNFFDQRNNKSYESFTIAMGSILNDFNVTLSRTKTRGNALQQEAHAIAHYAHNQFGNACNVFKQYRGKGKGSAISLLTTLQKQFKIETALGQMKSKLQALLNKAKEKENTQLVTTINRFIDFIDKKRIAWSRRNRISLLVATQYRIDIR